MNDPMLAPDLTADDDLPTAEVAPRGLTLAEVEACMPDRIPFFGGEPVDEPEDHDRRIRLLAMILVNVGLKEAVRLAPRERWLEALDAEASSFN